MPYCEHCGGQISEETKFCRNCGQEVIEISETRERPKRERKARPSPPKEEPTEEEPPKGGEPPTKAFKIGSIGALLSAIGVMIFGLMFTSVRIGDPAFWRLLISISAILIAIGCILVGIGFYGFYRNYDQMLGIINFVLTLFTAIIWLTASVIIANADNLGSRGINTFIIVLVLCLFFSGIMLILQGVNIYTIRKHTTDPNLASGQSFISIIAGTSCASIVMVTFYGAGLYVWAVAYFLLIPVFLKRESPLEEDEEDGEDKEWEDLEEEDFD